MKGIQKHRKFDLIHLHAPFVLGGEQMTILAHKMRIPLVITYHQDLMGRGLARLAFAGYNFASVGTQLLKADAVVVPTMDFAKHSAVSNYLLAAKRLVEIPSGVDVTLFAPGKPRGRRIS